MLISSATSMCGIRFYIVPFFNTKVLMVQYNGIVRVYFKSLMVFSGLPSHDPARPLKFYSSISPVVWLPTSGLLHGRTFTLAPDHLLLAAMSHAIILAQPKEKRQLDIQCLPRELLYCT